jgi:hypothetical protein
MEACRHFVAGTAIVVAKYPLLAGAATKPCNPADPFIPVNADNSFS